MDQCSILNHQGELTAFSYGGRTIRFKTSPALERYTRVTQWDHGYLAVMAKYKGHPETEGYIDLLPILDNLYIDANAFLQPIRKVRVDYDGCS